MVVVVRVEAVVVMEAVGRTAEARAAHPVTAASLVG